MARLSVVDDGGASGSTGAIQFSSAFTSLAHREQRPEKPGTHVLANDPCTHPRRLSGETEGTTELKKEKRSVAGR